MEPGDDIAANHDSQIALLDWSQWADWLDPVVPTADILRTLPGNSFDVLQVG